MTVAKKLNPQDLPRDQYVVFENDFSTGFEGWNGLLASGKNHYPSLHTASLQGPHSLCVDTYGGVANVEASASKRMGAFEGIWTITTRIAWNVHTTSGPEQNALDKIRIGLDWQRGVNRRWYEIQYLHYSEGTSSLYPRWRTTNGSAATTEVITDLSEASQGDGNGYELGYNQINKFDFHTIKIEFRTSTDTSVAKWHGIEVNGVSADLSNHDATGTQAVADEFDNGANLLFFCENRPTNANADPYLLVDYVRVEWSK